MHVEISRGAVVIRLGPRFAMDEAERLGDTLGACGPVKVLDLDFSQVLEFEDAAVIPLARVLGTVHDASLRMRGLTLHQRRMLRYFGIDEAAQATVH
jgi:hypothetical protein